MDDIQETLLGKTQPVRQNMGIGKIGSPEITFVRKFRWTLKGTNLEEHFLKNVKFDFKQQRMEIEAYEIVIKDEDINIHTWLESDLSKEQLVFTTYDGYGFPIYSYIFTNLDVQADTASFDYSSSAESTRKIALKYGAVTRNFHPKQKVVIQKKRFDWKISVEGSEAKPVKIDTRPMLNAEEIEINFLNTKMWLPAEWIKMHIDIPESSRCLFGQIMNNQSGKVSLIMLDMNGNILETWKLNNVKVIGMSDQEENMSITLSYNDVRYESAAKPEVSTVITKEATHV